MRAMLDSHALPTLRESKALLFWLDGQESPLLGAEERTLLLRSRPEKFHPLAKLVHLPLSSPDTQRQR